MDTSPSISTGQHNLPQQATISIFTVSGTLVRKIKKDDSVTSVDWDLKNDYGIPIASGLYIIHVNAPGIGEKIIKHGNWKEHSELKKLKAV